MKTVSENLYFIVNDEDGTPRRFSRAEQAVKHAAIVSYSMPINATCSVFVHLRGTSPDDSPVGVMSVKVEYHPWE